jgi:hypothetical protein
MTNANNTDAAPTTVAQLYWDDQDPNYVGWCLRHTDKRGNEDAIAIDGDKIEGIATLAERCAEALSDYGRTTIKAFVAGEHNPARIVVDGGDVIDWRR